MEGNEQSCGTFESKAEFKDYYNRFYRPILDGAKTGDTLDATKSRRLHFLKDDMDAFFGIIDEEDDDEQ